MRTASFLGAFALSALATAALLGCQTMTVNVYFDAGGASGDAGPGGSGGSGPTTATTGTPPLTHPPVLLGYGGYAAPCGSDGAFVERAESLAELGSLASKAIRLTEAPGLVTRVSVVHLIEDAAAFCDEEGRDVLVSEPTNLAVPSSPGLHESLHFTLEDVLDAPIYDLPGVEYGRARVLTRELAVPMHAGAVGEGDYVHVGSLLASEATCALGCGEQLDGSAPPEGDAFCTVGQSWTGCGVMPSPDDPGEFHLAYVAWLDVVPDAP